MKKIILERINLIFLPLRNENHIVHDFQKIPRNTKITSNPNPSKKKPKPTHFQSQFSTRVIGYLVTSIFIQPEKNQSNMKDFPTHRSTHSNSIVYTNSSITIIYAKPARKKIHSRTRTRCRAKKIRGKNISRILLSLFGMLDKSHDYNCNTHFINK